MKIDLPLLQNCLGALVANYNKKLSEETVKEITKIKRTVELMMEHGTPEYTKEDLFEFVQFFAKEVNTERLYDYEDVHREILNNFPKWNYCRSNTNGFKEDYDKFLTKYNKTNGK